MSKEHEIAVLELLKVFDLYWDLSQLMYELVDDQFTMVHVAVSLGRYIFLIPTPFPPAQRCFRPTEKHS